MNGLINRQYVGARYVPKIMGEWNKALQYEELSIVTYKGNSFTSKVPVPTNIDISNTNYWVNTGNYNAQVEGYREDVNKLSSNLTAEISDRKNADKDNILWIGDSYSSNYNHKLPNGVRDMLNAKNWYEHSRGGAGFVGKWAGADFNDLINEAINSMSSSEKENIKYIYIVGGANDSNYDWTTIKPKVISTVANARNNFPNAQVCFIFASCAFTTYQKLFGITVNICNDNILPCIFALPHYYISGTLYESDNLHFTNSATNYIISTISNLICGSTTTPTITVNNKHSFEGWSSSGNLYCNALDGHLNIDTPYLLLSKNTVEPFDTDQYNNTILLKSQPISADKRDVIPLRPTRLLVLISINNTNYIDYLECAIDSKTNQLIWTTNNKYPETASMVIKIIG